MPFTTIVALETTTGKATMPLTTTITATPSTTTATATPSSATTTTSTSTVEKATVKAISTSAIDDDVVILSVSVEKLPPSLTPAQESELADSFVSAVMSAGVPKDDIKGVDFDTEIGNDSVDTVNDAPTPLDRLSTVNIRIAGGSDANLATTAEVLLVLSFQVTADGSFVALPKAVGICRSGRCTGPSMASDGADACPALDLNHFSAASHGRGRREEVFHEAKTDNVDDCAKLCLNYKGCGAFQYRSDRTRCELSSVSAVQQHMRLIHSPYWEHRYREIFCTRESQLQQQSVLDATEKNDVSSTVASSVPVPVTTDNDGADELTTTAGTAAVFSTDAPSTSVPAWTVDVSIIEREGPILETSADPSGPKTTLSKSSLIITVTAVLVVLLILAGMACMSNSNTCMCDCKPRMPATFRKFSKSASTGSFKHWDITNSPDPKQSSMEDLFWDGNGILALSEGDYHRFGPRPLSIVPSMHGNSDKTSDEYIETGLKEDMEGFSDDDEFPFQPSPMSSAGSFQYSAGSSNGTYVLASHTGIGEHDPNLAQTTGEYHVDDEYELANGGSPIASSMKEMPLMESAYPDMLDAVSSIVSTYDNYRDLDKIANERIAKQKEARIIKAAAAATRTVMQQKPMAETPCPEFRWNTSPNKVHLEGGRRSRRGGGSEAPGFVGV